MPTRAELTTIVAQFHFGLQETRDGVATGVHPMGSMVLSTLLAAAPVVVMLVALGFLHITAHIAAGMGLVAAIAVAVLAYGMPIRIGGNAALLGGSTSLLPIGTAHPACHDLRPHDLAGALLAADHRADARPWLSDTLLRHRQDAQATSCATSSSIPLRRPAWWACSSRYRPMSGRSR